MDTKEFEVATARAQAEEDGKTKKRIKDMAEKAKINNSLEPDKLGIGGKDKDKDKDKDRDKDKDKDNDKGMCSDKEKKEIEIEKCVFYFSESGGGCRNGNSCPFDHTKPRKNGGQIQITSNIG